MLDTNIVARNGPHGLWPSSDFDFRCQCPENRTLLCDLQELRALLVIQIAEKLDLAVDPVKHALFRLAGLAVLSVNLRVP